MMSDEQFKVKEMKVMQAVAIFLKPDIMSIKEVANKMEVSTSSVQRYLNEENLIEAIFGMDTCGLVKEKLKMCKKYGLSKGGIISQQNNGYCKDENGKFRGSRKR